MLAAKVEREMRSKRALGSPEDFLLLLFVCLFICLRVETLGGLFIL